jgi:hypothetical protein
MTDNPDTRSAAFFTDGVITVVALILVFLALDDITTDNARTFLVEYSVLLVCAGWLVHVSARVLHSGRRVLGTLSILALVAGVGAQRAVAPGIVPGLSTEYVVLSVTYLWFWVLAGALLWLGRRRPSVGHGAIV